MRELNQTLNKTCPTCGIGFETKVPDKVYCTIYCRNARHRALAREREQRNGLFKVEVDKPRYFAQPMNNPTAESVVALANLLVDCKSDQPMLFRGTMPEIDLSKIKVSLTATANPSEWIMFYDVNKGQDVMEILLAQEKKGN